MASRHKSKNADRASFDTVFYSIGLVLMAAAFITAAVMVCGVLIFLLPFAIVHALALVHDCLHSI